MKNLVESGEVFAAYAQIDLCYYMIEDVYKRYSVPRIGIVAAIDKATGYDKHRYKEAIASTMGLLKVIIKNKKVVGADYSGDQKLFGELKKLATTQQK
jgi:hypothetical protein